MFCGGGERLGIMQSPRGPIWLPGLDWERREKRETFRKSPCNAPSSSASNWVFQRQDVSHPVHRWGQVRAT